MLPGTYLSVVNEEVSNLDRKLDRKTAKYIQAFQRQEAKLLRKLARKDSVYAAQLQAVSQARYNDLAQSLKGNNPLQEYIPALDTLTTSLKFLSQHQGFLSKTNEATKQLSQTIQNVAGLQASLSKAEAVNRFLQERKQSLIAQLQDGPFAKDLTKLSKQAYYNCLLLIYIYEKADRLICYSIPDYFLYHSKQYRNYC